MKIQDKIAGWLIIHSENMDNKTFNIYEGKNIIGRYTNKHFADIEIDNDKYISRHHAAVFARVNSKNEYEYLIADNADILGKPSLNGTFINGNSKRLNEQAFILKDGDTIQIGMTKLVLKTTHIAINVENAVKLVSKQEYKETINIINSATLKTNI